MVFNKRFGRYRLVTKLASGGMAEVLLALKSGPDAFDKLVALKCMHPHMSGDSQSVDMFYREARLSGLFRHPNLIHALDAELIRDRHTMVMEFVPGATVEALAERVPSGEQLPVAWCLHILSEAALGLHAAHEQGDLDGTPLEVVHRDISPHNIQIGFDGRVKVFDFGVAVAASRGGGEGGLAGKAAYMSPEQCRGRSVDRRSDVFALGIVLHELLTGQRLYKRDNHIQSIRAITEDTPGAPSNANPEVPPELDAVVLKALAQQPDARYATALQLQKALVEVQHRHGLFFDDGAASREMQRLFRSEIEELDAVVQKILSAPELSEASVDLTNVGPRPTPESAGEVQVLEGSGLDALIADAAEQGPGMQVPDPRGQGAVLGPQAGAAVVDQLQRARRLNGLLAVTLVAALVAVAAMFARSSGADVEPEPVAPVQAALLIETTPQGASLTLNGEDTGEVTPSEVIAPVGESTYGLTLEGYLPVEGVVDVTAEGATVSHDLAVDLESPYAPIGSVRVVYEPETAVVYVGDVRRGEQSPLLLDALALNREHEIRLEHPGYETLRLPVMVENDEVLDLQVELAEALDLGRFVITSTPQGATVSLNGEEIGRTPIDPLELPANQTYTIEVERRGYTRWRRAILLRAGVDEVVDVRLTRPEAPREERRAAPPAAPAERPAPAEAPAEAPSADEDSAYELLE